MKPITIKELAELVEQGQRLQEDLGITDVVLDEIYDQGRHHFENEQYSHAIPLFRRLTRFNPVNKGYWMALAMAYARAEQMEEALNPLAVATVLDPEDPEPHYFSGLCLIALGDKVKAAQAMKEAAKLGDEMGFEDEMIQEAKNWVEELK